jgi:hypothetical protein
MSGTPFDTLPKPFDLNDLVGPCARIAAQTE